VAPSGIGSFVPDIERREGGFAALVEVEDQYGGRLF